ncbi:MAG: hypothetical protein ABIZ09_19670 [Rhodoferax sp.]
MSKIRILSASLLVTTLLVQPAMAQSKDQAASAKTVADFIQVSRGMAASLADLSKRTTTASPNDKDMLKLVTAQLSLVDATADGVTALGVVAAEMRDGRDMAAAKKYLAIRCTAFKLLADASSKYVTGVAPNIAAVATVAEVNKARDQVVQMSQHPLCNAGK